MSSLLLFSNSCDKETTCGGEFYKGNFIDEMIVIDRLDTTNILIEYLYNYQSRNDSIPYYLNTKSDSSDLIKLNYFVSYGSYSNESPDINKEVHYLNDTLFVWYSTTEKFNKYLLKSSSIVDVECSPREEYIIIDSMQIEIGKNKVVSVNSRSKFN